MGVVKYESMTHSELVRMVAQLVDTDKEDVEDVLSMVIAVLIGRLRTGEDVKIRGLGTFHWQFRKKSRRKNPKTQQWVEVKERYTLKFRPVQKLKDMEIK